MPKGRAEPIAAAVLLAAILFCVRPLGLANAVSTSPAQVPLLCIAFLIGYLLGYQTGVLTGLTGVALLIAALTVVNGSFSPIGPMITIGPWAAGQIIRSRRRLADQLRVRNEELRAQQEAYAAEAVRYERSRIAADLHDIVGHSLSMMVIQASAGQRAVRGRGGDGAARTALETVAEAARQAQAEVGLLAGLLRDDRVPDGGLNLTAELVRRARAAGLEVTYRLSGDADVDAASAEIASRIVTEALTNALKHAPGAPVTVELRTAADTLTVTVENGAAGPAGPDLARSGGGYGLAGMRDRVLARGGRIDAGPTQNGGWQVHAVLPRY